MNKIKYLLSSILLIGAILVGCTDKVEYNAAPQVEGEGVYFSKDQSSQLEAYEVTGSVELLIYRTSLDTDVDMPLNVEMENSVSEVLSIPSIVKFTKGSNVASIIIKHTNAIIDKAYPFSISINETTPYGLSTFNGQFMYVDPAPWEVISKDAIFFENKIGRAHV